ncbi:hypothetical protein GCM10009792_24870 [Microcella alkalica]|uniref:SRPBCC domain-containing protein n=1 Tax=Microcella alkalica TaxID=355930 RepID=A0A839EFM8_9MICO|nr:hypothetical protein [Microcella alkalica]
MITTPTAAVTSGAFRVEIRTSIEIDAAPAIVWGVLTDTAAYPEWNGFIVEWTGELARGERQNVLLQPPGGKPQRFRPRIVTLDAGRELVWLGRLGIPGVLDGRHRFVIEPLAGARARLRHEETLTGALVPALRRLLTETTPTGFERMNRELAARAEAAAA